MVKEFTVRNFRNVAVEKMALGKVNLLIGPNGSGKSNFLKALGFWTGFAQKINEGTTAFYETMSQQGWSRMLNFSGDSRFVDFLWSFEPDGSPESHEYKLKLHVGDTSSRQDFNIAYESLTYSKPVMDGKAMHSLNLYQCHEQESGLGHFKAERGRPKLPIRDNEAAFLQIDELRKENNELDQVYRDMYAGRISNFQKYLSRFFCYATSLFDLKQVKWPKADTGAANLAPDAGNLASLLQRWQREDYDAFCDYRNMITPLFGGAQAIDLFIEPIPISGALVVAIGINRQRYLLDDLSDGQIRAMILAALLVDRKNKMSVCAIDEPETNLHPEWQSRFTHWLLTSNSSQQFFISTHSPEILDPLTPAFMDGDVKVFVFSDNSTIKELTPDKISDLSEKGFNLGDLYRAKAIEIGGWS